MIRHEDLKRLANDSKNGQQTKGEINGKWYKFDKHGYESAAEAICADINYALGVKDYVEYRECLVSRNGIPVAACVSDDFSVEGYKIMTLEELASIRCLRDKLNVLQGDEPVSFLRDFLDISEKITGLRETKDYILDLLWLDMIYYNVDRHINNFSFYVGKDIRLAPYYDFGEALFSDMRIFKGVENESTAIQYMSKWPMYPLQFPIVETVKALKEFKECPYDLSLLDSVPIVSSQSSVIPRASMCLSLTRKIIETV